MLRTVLALTIALSVPCIAAAQAGSMAEMMRMTENSVGFLSSGTSIEPRTTSELTPMVHAEYGNWLLMFHGKLFLTEIQQTGPRGGDKLFSPGWFMPMAFHSFGRSTLTLRGMWSLEPATITKRRYPELFQTGETAFGLPIVDGQHPHEFWSELSARYDFHINDRTGIYIYAAPIGEPAIGPPSFPHRASASENPLAVLGHHEQDSTHVSSNVFTFGFVRGPVQIEASSFHGREPDENRWNIDIGKPDSFASRITVAAGSRLVGQFSAGRINNREAFDPELDTLRMTASLLQTVRLGSGYVASSLIWGRNKDLDPSGARIFNSYLAESTVQFLENNWAWMRIENVDRDRTLLTGETPAALTVEEDPIGRVQAYTFGYERELPVSLSLLKAGLGAQATLYGLGANLKAVYGERPATFVVFLRFRPKGTVGQHMRMMHP